ncbi:hypothetical protein CSA37_07960 [Candidatus Fermentibacteria bacterium]|nr:MAG: hypothetical protein CSA37_07960 [Candidatus Fermentibacteria bacterium]
MKTRTLIPSLLLLSGVLFFSQTLFYGFVSDDFYLINRVEEEGFYFCWGGESNTSFFRPAVVLSFAVDHWIWGKGAAGYHMTNILWHLVCSVLVFILAGEVLGNRIQALSAGVLFLFLACHSESVAWISGRTDILATVFALAALIFFIRGRFLSTVFFALGLLAKESVIITPLICLLLAVNLKQFSARRLLPAASGAAMLLYIAVRFAVSPELASRSGFSFQLQEIPENLLRYCFRVFVPPVSESLRPFSAEHPLMIPFLVMSAAAVVWFTSDRSRERRQTVVLAGCFFAALLPVLFMKVSFFDSRSERFLYFPGVFAVILLVRWAFAVLAEKKALVLLIIVTVVQAAGLQSSLLNWKRAGEMCDDITRELAELDPEAVTLVNIPDSYNGAYVFRNGLNEAVSMHTGMQVQFRKADTDCNHSQTVDVAALALRPE